MAFAIPLQVKTFPAGLEERVETDVIVIVGFLDFAYVQQLAAFLTDLLPVVLQRFQFWKGLDRQVGLGRVFGEQVQEAVDRGQEAGVVAQLASQLVANPTAQVNIGDREDEDKYECNFHGRLLVEKWPCAEA